MQNKDLRFLNWAKGKLWLIFEGRRHFINQKSLILVRKLTFAV